MCCLGNCCSWSLDFIQRVITFLIVCCLCGAVCFGLTLAIVSGIAYGYHYSMAEFLMFTRSDITVYLRRGQFYDKPDIRHLFRRKGDVNDLFATNVSTDYEEHKPLEGDAKPLSDSWVRMQDTKSYAEKLTKYVPPKHAYHEELERPVVQLEDSVQNQSQPISNLYVPSVVSPLPIGLRRKSNLAKTTLWQSGPGDLVMRNFRPSEDVTPPSKPKHPGFGIPLDGHEYSRSKVRADENIPKVVDIPESYLPIRPRATTILPSRPTLPEPLEEPDDDNIIYKPV